MSNSSNDSGTDPADGRVEVRIGGRVRRLKFTQRSKYRMGTIPNFGSLTGYAELATLVWALLDEPNPRESPEDIAMMLTDEVIEEVARKVNLATEAGKPTPAEPSDCGDSAGSNSD